MGPENRKTAQELSSNAMDLFKQGDLTGAQPLFERALAVYEKAVGPDHPDTADVMNNLGMVLMNQGDFVGAQPLFERALAAWEKTMGPDHPNTAGTMNNLGMVLMGHGDFTGAQPLFERALAVYEKTPGLDQTDTAKVLNNLGMVLMNQGDFAGAQPLLERCLAINEKTMEADHPLTAQALYNLATALMNQDDLDGAKSLFSRALAILEKSLGQDHPITVMMRNQMAMVLNNQSDADGTQEPGDSSQYYKDPPSPLEFTEVGGEEAEEIIKAAAQYIEPDVYPADKTIVSKASLPFYEGVEFCRITDTTLPPPNSRYVYYGNGGAIPHDWTNEVIYTLNESQPVILNDDTIIPYVRFFFHYVRGQLGRFELMNSIDHISWLPEATQEEKDAVRSMLLPVLYRGIDQNGMHVLVATVIFKNALFKTKILVASEPLEFEDEETETMERFSLGQAKLTGEDLLIEDLNVAIAPPPGELG